MEGGDSVPRGFYPFACSQSRKLADVARSGLRYNPDTNLCRNAAPEVGGLPPIAIPPNYTGFDPLTTALRAALLRVQGAATEECRAAAADNRRLAEHLAICICQTLTISRPTNFRNRLFHQSNRHRKSRNLGSPRGTNGL